MAWINESDKIDQKKTSMLSELFRDYCSHSTIHGINYIGAKDKTILEKIWWVLGFLLSFTVCVILIHNIWTKWSLSPVIVSFAQEQTPIWQVPFPAVTICPVNKVNNTKYDYTDMFRRRQNLTGDEYKKFWDISLVCTLEYYGVPSEGSPNTSDEEAVTNIMKVAPDLRQISRFVVWQYQLQTNEGFFTETLTEEGVCFTANSLGQKDMFTDSLNHEIKWINHDIKNEGWTIDKGYPSGTSINTYPRRTGQDGYAYGLMITLITEFKDMNHLCGFPVSGYKITFHNPAEIPKPQQQYIFVPFDKEVSVSVSPELVTTSLGLLSIAPKIRKCYFSHEKSLKFFRVYTQNNCKAECHANMSSEFCGCVPFYLPRKKGTKICGYGSLECTSALQRKAMEFEMLQKENIISASKLENSQYKVYEKCDCLPACSSLQYSVQSSSADSHYTKTVSLSKEAQYGLDERVIKMVINKEVALTQLNIFFKESQFIALTRSELFGQTDFIANCGGLLGLFMGFSFLSLLEIVYYLTIRLWYKMKRRKEVVVQHQEHQFKIYIRKVVY